MREMVIKQYSRISINRYSRLLFLKLCLSINKFNNQSGKIIHCPWEGGVAFRYLIGQICCFRRRCTFEVGYYFFFPYTDGSTLYSILKYLVKYFGLLKPTS